MQDPTEALAMARELAGTPSERNLPASNSLSQVENLRAMLNDDGVRDNPRALATRAIALRELR